MTLQITESNFEEEILRSDIPAIVDFSAAWCGPCRMMSPMIDQIATEKAGVAKVGKVDVDSDQALAARFNVNSIPTLHFFKNGELVDTIVGSTTKENILAHLNRISAPK